MCVCLGSHSCKRHHLPSCLLSVPALSAWAKSTSSCSECFGRCCAQSNSVEMEDVSFPLQCRRSSRQVPSTVLLPLVGGPFAGLGACNKPELLLHGMSRKSLLICCTNYSAPPLPFQHYSTTAPPVSNYSPALARLQHCSPTISSFTTESIGPPSGPAAPIFTCAPGSPLVSS